MNIEEARKVFWNSNNPRPLGELLAEGLLTKKDLEWAAERAYNPKLKLAAKVILESGACVNPEDNKGKSEVAGKKEEHTGLEIGVSLETARATHWPFSPYKDQPMGRLLESKQIALIDLVYAIEKAWDEKVRQAAIALMLVKLKQDVKEPTPSAGFVDVVSGGRSFAQRRENLLNLLQGALFGFMFAVTIYFLFPSLRGVGKPNPNGISVSEFISRPNGILSLGIALGILILTGLLFNMAFNKINNKIEKQIEAYRLGQEGEDRVVQLIVQVLDGNWHLFRNIQIPGRNRGDLDLVLVGPPGMWVLEVKNFNGNYRNIGENWQHKKGKNWKNISKSPSRQAYNNALRLSNFLKADKLKVFVNSVVVWANPESVPFIENPSVAVWHHNRLADELGNIWQGEKLSEVERKKITEKLTKLCEEQKKSSTSSTAG